ncbi:Coiled-coil domain-containing protein 92 [Argiope bruennichi]|uniref:Coiled-coil domain-containing protein 92 n=1 Tax=Argiope bruennichi TaxID=94029 RepID=A0A8T0FFB6_ARGBR|nr:Coiled-coil domain-containing protein 92 [Argiope bruennichi]
MTQEIKHLPLQSTAIKCANEFTSLEPDAGGEGSFYDDPNDIIVLREKLKAAQDSIRFLQDEHALMLKGLHEEIERLQDLCRDLQFRCETSGCLLPDSDSMGGGIKNEVKLLEQGTPTAYSISEMNSRSNVSSCWCCKDPRLHNRKRASHGLRFLNPDCLEQKVNNLLKENADLKRKLVESHQAIDILDQKEKLALWQHHQEMEQRDSAILRLEKELEAKCTTIAQLTSQGARRKKGSFWRRFSFANSNHPSTSHSAPHSKLQPSRVEHLSREDLPSEMQNSLQSLESQYQSYSSYSSLSDKSVSDDEGFNQRCDGDGQNEGLQESGLSVKLPPISNLPLVSSRQLVRHQLRIKNLASKLTTDTLAIDQRQVPDASIKRMNKA